MRTNVVIDDALMARALKIGGYRTKRAAIEEGLRLVAQFKSQQKLRRLRGKVQWQGDLSEMRRD